MVTNRKSDYKMSVRYIDPYKRDFYRDEIPAMDAFEAIYTRRTCRDFTRDVVPDWKIERIMDAARWAPSPDNTQNWRYLLVRDRKLKDAVAEVATEASSGAFGGAPYSITAGRLWYLPAYARAATVEEMVQRKPRGAEGARSTFSYNAEADVMVLACYGGISEGPISYFPLAMGVQNMWLATTALELGMGFNFFPVSRGFNVEWLKEILGIPPGWMPRATLGIGVPSRRRALGPSRYPLEGIVYWERWGRPYKRTAFRKEGE